MENYPKTFRMFNTYNANLILNKYVAANKELSPAQCDILSEFFGIIGTDPLTAHDSKRADMTLLRGNFGVN